MTQFAYNNFKHSFIEKILFYLMYDYYFEIYYEVENNFIVKRVSAAKDKVKWLNNMRNSLSQRFN